MKLGYTTWGMPMLPVDAALEHLADLGFDGVELTVIHGYTTELDTLDAAERRRIRELLDRYGLDLPAIAGHASLLSKDADGNAENWRRLTKAVDLCVDLAGEDGPAALDTVLGSGPDTWNGDEDFVLQRLGKMVDYCTPRQVILSLEPHVGDGLCHQPEKIVWLLEQIDSPYLKLNFDISHFDIQGISTEESVAILAPHSAHTHVKDQRGRVPDFDFLIPGEGSFDYVTYLQEMEKAGYEGYITAEVSMQVQRRPDYDPLTAAELTYRTLDRAFREAGIQTSRST